MIVYHQHECSHFKNKTCHRSFCITCMCSAPCPCAAASLVVRRGGLGSQTWRGRSAAGRRTPASGSQTSPAYPPCSRWPTSEDTQERRERSECGAGKHNVSIAKLTCKAEQMILGNVEAAPLHTTDLIV